LLLEARCPRCRALIRLKRYTPLFFSPIQCKACKQVFQLPSKGSRVVE
jgi:phage FluMu protein Com